MWTWNDALWERKVIRKAGSGYIESSFEMHKTEGYIVSYLRSVIHECSQGSGSKFTKGHQRGTYSVNP